MQKYISRKFILRHSSANYVRIGETIKKGLLYSFNTQNGINYFTFNNVTNTLEIYNQNHILTNTTIFPETPQKIHFIKRYLSLPKAAPFFFHMWV